MYLKSSIIYNVIKFAAKYNIVSCEFYYFINLESGKILLQQNINFLFSKFHDLVRQNWTKNIWHTINIIEVNINNLVRPWLQVCL